MELVAGYLSHIVGREIAVRNGGNRKGAEWMRRRKRRSSYIIRKSQTTINKQQLNKYSCS
jgi:hypothetical protein